MLLPSTISLLPCLVPSIHSAPVDSGVPISSHPPLKGNILEFDDSISQQQSDFKICSERGNRYWNTLAETLLNPNAQEKADTSPIFAQGYVATYKDTATASSASSDLVDDLEADGIDANSMDLWWTGDNLPRGDEEEFDAPYQNYFNTRDGIIIASMNFRRDDKRRDDKLTSLNWSELMYHTWFKLQNGPMKRQRKLLLMSLISLSIIRLLYENNGLVPGGNRPEDQAWVQWTEAKIPYFWDALVGTDNVRGTVYLLNDHPMEIGKKIITEIWTSWEILAPDIWINIGPNPYDEIPDLEEMRCPDERCRKKQKVGKRANISLP
ncbi:MAG: hypothetical protein Q9169_006188 [Polycauliona sp. 2 TL-2023]